MNGKRSGFTIVELLTALAIIAILVGLLIPSLTMVRNMAKETRQKAQFAAIGQALLAFRGDYGDYPPSNGYEYDGREKTSLDYPGTQKLAEALAGQDLLGFHPGSYWYVDGSGVDRTGQPIFCYPQNPSVANLDARRGPYLELATANAFTLRQLFGDTPGTLAPDTYVLCDSFGVKRVSLRVTLPSGETKVVETVMAGTPILYYRANTASRQITYGDYQDRIYNCDDNIDLLNVKFDINGTDDPLRWYDGERLYDGYEYKLINPQVTTRPWPHRPDSYILISAGADGLYGTADDITNF